MQQVVIVLAVFAGLIASCQASLIEYASELPTCGLACMLELIPQSDCLTFTNDSCICTNELLISEISACVLSNCTTFESLDVERVEKEACGAPVRSRRPLLQGLIGLEVFTVVCVIARLWARWRYDHWGMDDYVMMFVLALLIPFNIVGEYARLTAFGVDTWTVEPDVLVMGLKMFYVDETLYLALLTATKISILLFYLRIFPNTRFYIAAYTTIGLVLATGVAFILAQILQCLPIRYNWDRLQDDPYLEANHKCADVLLLVESAAIASIVLDGLVLVLPLPVLARLQVDWRRKQAILLMFGVGIFCVLAGCVRLYYIMHVYETTNPSWEYTDTFVWTSIEMCIAVLVSCLPALRLLYVHALEPAVHSLYTFLCCCGGGRRRARSPSTGDAGSSIPSSQAGIRLSDGRSRTTSGGGSRDGAVGMSEKRKARRLRKVPKPQHIPLSSLIASLSRQNLMSSFGRSRQGGAGDVELGPTSPPAGGIQGEDEPTIPPPSAQPRHLSWFFKASRTNTDLSNLNGDIRVEDRGRDSSNLRQLKTPSEEHLVLG